MFAPKILAAFLFAIVVNEGASESTLNVPQRSERWDKYIQSIEDAHEERRTRRQVGAEWHSNRANCNPAEYTTRDTIGRRASGILAEPQNQGYCGSCWAFASVHTLTDQLSITQGSHQPVLSAGHLNSCLKDTTLVGNGNGCCGAKVLHAGPKFLRDTGAVTATCSPYNPNTRKRNLPVCPRTCANGSPFSLSSFRTMGYEQLNSEQEILTALDAGSVVLVVMIVTHEFKTYKCGIYQDSRTTSVISRHAVEIVDYGTATSGTNFWVIKNSWGTDRQENGYFRIKRGQLGIGTIGALRFVAGSNIQDTITSSVCAETPVSNPASDEMIMSSIEFVEQQLLAMNLISCTDGTSATGITRESIMTADAQVVAGIRVDIEVLADVMGCSETTKADITASVIIDLDGNFTLNTRSVNTRTASSAKIFTAYWWPLLFLAALIAAFV